MSDYIRVLGKLYKVCEPKLYKVCEAKLYKKVTYKYLLCITIKPFPILDLCFNYLLTYTYLLENKVKVHYCPLQVDSSWEVTLLTIYFFNSDIRFICIVSVKAVAMNLQARAR